MKYKLIKGLPKEIDFSQKEIELIFSEESNKNFFFEGHYYERREEYRYATSSYWQAYLKFKKVSGKQDAHTQKSAYKALRCLIKSNKDLRHYRPYVKVLLDTIRSKGLYSFYLSRTERKEITSSVRKIRKEYPYL